MDDIERALATAADEHWLESNVAQGFARCSCGKWRVDLDSLTVPSLGEHFAPFSEHVAASQRQHPAVVAALGIDRASALAAGRLAGFEDALTEVERLRAAIEGHVCADPYIDPAAGADLRAALAEKP